MPKDRAVPPRAAQVRMQSPGERLHNALADFQEGTPSEEFPNGLAGKELEVDGVNKPRFDLIPPKALRELAELYDMGAKKYGDRNWEYGRPWGDYIAACYRHLNAFHAGEEYDPKDGQHHLASVAWLALALMTFRDTHQELDNRASTVHNDGIFVL